MHVDYYMWSFLYNGVYVYRMQDIKYFNTMVV